MSSRVGEIRRRGDGPLSGDPGEAVPCVLPGEGAHRGGTPGSSTRSLHVSEISSKYKKKDGGGGGVIDSIVCISNRVSLHKYS